MPQSDTVPFFFRLHGYEQLSKISIGHAFFLMGIHILYGADSQDQTLL